MNRIIIFGAGVHGRRAYRALRRIHDDVEVIGFIDNNSKNKGKKCLGNDIYSPSELHTMSFDKVVIAGRNIEEMSRQLSVELLVPDSKIWPMKRSEIMPSAFEKKRISESIDDLLKKLLCIFSSNNISYWMDESALLALKRGVCLAEFADVDISLISSQHASVLLKELKHKDLGRNLEKTGYEVSVDYKTIGSVQLHHIIIKSKVITEEEELACIDINVKALCGDVYLVPFRDRFRFTPIIHYSGFDVIHYHDMKLRIPIYSDKYLSLTYGVNWKIPSEYWKASDYGNIVSDIDVPIISKSQKEEMGTYKRCH
jgi:hypothetical protein